MKKTVRKAIIPAAGLGTRFLPATKSQPKEMLPIVDKPTLQYIIEEAINSGIEEINVDEDNPNYSVREGVICNGESSKALYNKDGSVFISPIKLLGTIETYEILSNVGGIEVKEIADYAFHNQNHMTNITVPDTIEKIGNSFNFCTSLTSIEIPSCVTEINTSCFTNSTNLTQIIIHNTEGSIQGQPWGCIYGDRAVYWVGK